MRKRAPGKLAAIFCAVFRHSHLVTNCMGYLYCARCGAQLGDNIGGSGLPAGTGGYFLLDGVCECVPCRQSFDTLTWLDRFLCPKAVFPEPGAIEKRRAENDALMAAIRQDNSERAERLKLREPK